MEHFRAKFTIILKIDNDIPATAPHSKEYVEATRNVLAEKISSMRYRPVFIGRNTDSTWCIECELKEINEVPAKSHIEYVSAIAKGTIEDVIKSYAKTVEVLLPGARMIKLTKEELGLINKTAKQQGWDEE